MAPSLGQQLKKIREDRGISLAEIAQKTRLRLVYLEAIEANNLEALPSPMHLRGFLRLYASFLGVELEALQIDRPQAEPDLQGKPDSNKTPQADVPVKDEADGIPDNVPVTPQESEDPPPAESQPQKALPPEAIQAEPAAAPTSAEIFQDIGQRLHQRRESLSLSLADIEEHLHVRQRYLKAMEAGQFDQLPSPVQSRGMLVNYSAFLNLDADAMLLEYADALQQKRLESQTPLPGKKAARPLSPYALRLKTFFSVDLVVITVLFLVFAGFVIWGVNRILSTNDPEAVPTDLPEVANILLATEETPAPQQTATLAGTPGDGTTETAQAETPSPLFTPMPNNSPLAVVVIPRQRAWVRVTVDEEVVYEGRLIPGNVYDYAGETQIVIRTGNAGAIQVYFNDQDLGIPGLIGQVVELVFNKNGLIQPTPTLTPTITETPQSTPTPSPSPTETDDEAI